MSPEQQAYYVQNLGAQTVIERLTPYVTAARQQRIATVLNARLSSIELAIESPGDLHNIYAAMRSCEIFGLVKIHVISPERIGGSIHAISKGALYWLQVEHHKTLDDFLAATRQSARLLAGAVLHVDAAIDVAAVPITQPLCLLFGNEHRGLSAQAQADCDLLFQIPMYGMTESLNVSVASGIALYEICKRRRAALHERGDLSSAQRQMLQATYYLNSVDPRLAGVLLR